MSATYLSDWRDKRIAALERELEEAQAQHAKDHDDLRRYERNYNDVVTELAERTRERDRARSYCAELASYVCEPIYDDVRNRAGIAADASAAAGDEMSMRWHDVQRAQARAESAERSLEEARKDAERYRWLRDTGDATWRPFGIREGCSAAQADAAIDSAIEAEKRG